MAESPSGRFQVELVGLAREGLLALAERAAQLGIKSQFLASYLRIVEHLATDPVAWGEQRCTYPTLGLREYHRLFEGLAILYAVDPINRLVYVKKCRPVLDHPLAES